MSWELVGGKDYDMTEDWSGDLSSVDKPPLCEVRAALATIYDIKGIVLQSRVQAEYYGEDGFVYSKIVRLIEKYEREHFA